VVRAARELFSGQRSAGRALSGSARAAVADLPIPAPSRARAELSPAEDFGGMIDLIERFTLTNA
jgi:hypothetical protein